MRLKLIAMKILGSNLKIFIAISMEILSSTLEV
jgi:hypothetical protein